ncbi:hypothetical protein [Arthrobacter sp. UYEF3]|uniref:hypothetical protein n=1 Tax=Arthrobacter sp. UYEF3 TaxID=1756365 RepID=UPI003399CF81
MQRVAGLHGAHHHRCPSPASAGRSSSSSEPAAALVAEPDAALALLLLPFGRDVAVLERMRRVELRHPELVQ